MWITRVSINNPVFATMMMAALLVLGLFSADRLAVEQFPDVAFPVVVIQTDWDGCRSSQRSTAGAGWRRISSDNTLVSRMIMPRV